MTFRQRIANQWVIIQYLNIYNVMTDNEILAIKRNGRKVAGSYSCDRRAYSME